MLKRLVLLACGLLAACAPLAIPSPTPTPTPEESGLRFIVFYSPL